VSHQYLVLSGRVLDAPDHAVGPLGQIHSGFGTGDSFVVAQPLAELRKRNGSLPEPRLGLWHWATPNFTN
jgi:hypothetical protein